MNRSQVKQYVFVIKELTGREIKRKYSRSYLGILWSILNPLLSLAVMSGIFSKMFIKPIENFPVYYLTGNIIWGFFTNATNSAMTALVDNKSLLIKVKLPMQVFMLSRVYTALVNFGYSFMAYLFFLWLFKVEPSLTMLVIVPVVLLLLLFSVGISMILSTLYVFFGDIKHLYGIALTLLMYMSAIFYPVTSLSGLMAQIVRENPIYCFITAARECMIYGTIPSLGIWIRIASWALGMFVIGQLFFRLMKNEIMQKV